MEKTIVDFIETLQNKKISSLNHHFNYEFELNEEVKASDIQDTVPLN